MNLRLPIRVGLSGLEVADSRPKGRQSRDAGEGRMSGWEAPRILRTPLDTSRNSWMACRSPTAGSTLLESRPLCSRAVPAHLSSCCMG
jgi:hypothetical protein